MEDSPDLEEELSEVAADLVSYKRLEPFLRRLFAHPPGRWLPVAACCSTMSDLPSAAARVFAEHGATFVVTHLPWPGLPEDDPYALALFVHSQELWSTIAMYNRAVFGDI